MHRNNKTRKLSVVACSVVVVLLTGCTAGAGSGSSTITTIPSGIYTGVGNITDNGTLVQGNVVAFVTSSGSYTLLWTGSSAGFAGNEITNTGTGSVSNGTFTSYNNANLGSYYYYEGGAPVDPFPNYLDGTLSATSVSNTSLNGTITYPTGGYVLSFQSPAPLQFVSGSTQAPASVSAIAGTYSGYFDTPGDPGPLGTASYTGSMMITSAGVLDGAVLLGGVNQCTMSGTATPRTDLNAYNFSYTFARATGGSCNISGVTATGIGYFAPSTGVLTIASTNAYNFTGTN